MRKVVFISDFFAHQVQGGAEIYDQVLIDELRSRGIKVATFNSSEFTSQHLNFYNQHGYYYIISNFVNLSLNIMSAFKTLSNRYIIIEHDHKYLSTRNPSDFRDFVAPKQFVINKDFYSSAKAVFAQSIKHKEVMEANLGTSNIISSGCSLWSKEQLENIRTALCDKNDKAFIMNDSNPIKGLEKALSFCDTNKVEYDLIHKLPQEQFIQTLAKYDKFVFFPKTLESFCRVVLEARMLGCKLVTNKHNGCTYENWFPKYKGLELIEFVDSQRPIVVDRICDTLFQEAQTTDGDITVILNCYRRPYNLKMQVEALRAQTVKPKEIWLWINQHEDNKDFDPTTLGVDKVFSNDHNWKFYGRFAASLLADTEYIAIYDDDTIPGSRWHENCVETMKTHEGILGSAGIILEGSKYVQHQRCGWPTRNTEVTPVDLVGHSWFFKREWLRYLWQEKPVTWDNGEDIQFGFMAKIHGGIQTYCPPHPPEDLTLHGSILGNELGIDDKATSTNRAVSHQEFFLQRDECVQEGLRKGWVTVKEIKL